MPTIPPRGKTEKKRRKSKKKQLMAVRAVMS